MKTLREQVRELPVEERILILDDLLCDDELRSQELPPAQQADLDLRIAELQAGDAELIDGEQVFAEAREYIKKRYGA